MTLRTLAITLTSTLAFGCAHATTSTPSTPELAAESEPKPQTEAPGESGVIGMTTEPGPQKGTVALPLHWDQELVFEVPDGVTLEPTEGPGQWFRWDDPSIDAHILAASTRDDRPLSELAADVFGGLGIQLTEPLGEGQPVVCADNTRGSVWAFASDAGSIALLGFEREHGRAFLLIGGPSGSTAAPGGALFEHIKTTMHIRPLTGSDPIPVGGCNETTASR